MCTLGVGRWETVKSDLRFNRLQNNLITILSFYGGEC